MFYSGIKVLAQDQKYGYPRMILMKYMPGFSMIRMHYVLKVCFGGHKNKKSLSKVVNDSWLRKKCKSVESYVSVNSIHPPDNPRALDQNLFVSA